MKRLFSNKSGFSLAEILVAIAIFSIMLAMIMQMLQLSIARRNENLQFSKDLNEQENYLVANEKVKSVTKGDDGKPNNMEDTPLRLNFVNPNDKTDPTKPLFKDVEDSGKNKGNGIPIDYEVMGTDDSFVDSGLNYFIGNYDYNADGLGGGDGVGGAGTGQTAQYDTRLTGSKGLKDITITQCKPVTSIPGVSSFAGTAYEITVRADSSSMQKDDKPYSQMRFFFYSSDKYDIKKVTKTKIGADGKPEMESDGKTPKKDVYYKKVYKTAKVTEVYSASGNVYTVQKSGDNAVRIGLPLSGSEKENGFKSGNSTTFYVVFSEDPNITATSFGNTGSNVYNRAAKYEIKIDEDGKPENVSTGTHVNIYGAKKFEVHKNKEDF